MQLLGGLIGIFTGALVSIVSLIGIVKLLSTKDEETIIREDNNTPSH